MSDEANWADINRAHDEGVDSERAGDMRAHNPHPDCGVKWWAWLAGWRLARHGDGMGRAERALGEVILALSGAERPPADSADAWGDVAVRVAALVAKREVALMDRRVGVPAKAGDAEGAGERPRVWHIATDDAYTRCGVDYPRSVFTYDPETVTCPKCIEAMKPADEWHTTPLPSVYVPPDWSSTRIVVDWAAAHESDQLVGPAVYEKHYENWRGDVHGGSVFTGDTCGKFLLRWRWERKSETAADGAVG